MDLIPLIRLHIKLFLSICLLLIFDDNLIDLSQAQKLNIVTKFHTMKTLSNDNESLLWKLERWQSRHRKLLQKWIAIGLFFAMLNLTGCMYYFKVNYASQPYSESISEFNHIGKTIYIHSGEKRWLFTNIVVSNDSISGQIQDSLLFPHLGSIKANKPNRYIHGGKNNERYLLNEVHVYINDSVLTGNQRITIPGTSIGKIEVYDKDTKATTASWVLGGVLLAATLTVLTISAINSMDIAPSFPETSPNQSCPYIYVWDKQNYNFIGEIYTGSVYQQLERNDYLKLPAYNGQKNFRLKVTNEVKEIQHTNLMELFVIDHSKQVDVLVDKYGHINTLAQQVLPTLATNLTGEDIASLLFSKDTLFYQSNQTGDIKPLKDGLILEYPVNKGAKSVKLVISAKNSLVMNYMMDQFYGLLGSAYNSYEKRQEHIPAAQMHQWTLEQGLPLSLYVERDGKWEFVDYYDVCGPLAFKEDVLTIPLKGNESDPLKLKLESGAFLWQIDYVAIDYTPDIKVRLDVVPIESAINEANKDVSGLLKSDDNEYYNQSQISNLIEVNFNLPAQYDENRTLILHSKGWYKEIRNQKWKPDFKTFKEFHKPGRFNQFVNERLTQSAKIRLQSQ